MTLCDLDLHGVDDDELSLLLRDTAVTVHVGKGEERQSWTIHKKLLTRFSPFFAAAFDGEFNEAATNTLVLEEDDPRAFKLFVQWLYTGKITETTEVIPGLGTLRDSDTCPKFLCVVWALGDKFNVPAFRDHAMGHLMAYHDWVGITIDLVREIYNLSALGSQLRCFAVCPFIADTRFEGLDGQLGWVGVDNGAMEIMSMEDFNRDVLKRTLQYGTNDNLLPYEDASSYLQCLPLEVIVPT